MKGTSRRHAHLLGIGVSIAICVACGAEQGFGQDWPQWRGPNRDGVAAAVKAPAEWPSTLEKEWTATVGEGVASPVIVGSRVFVFARSEDDEFVRCLNLETGKELWKSGSYSAPYEAGPGEDQPTAEKRPRSTPTIAEGRVYTLGMSGVVACLEADSGKVVWRQQFAALPYGGQSPLLADGKCIVHVGDGKSGGVSAFEAKTGEIEWCFRDGSSPSSGSPILVDVAGERQIVMPTSRGLLGLSLRSGKKLWSVPTSGGSCTPVLHGDLVIAPAGDKEPLRALRIKKSDQGISVDEAWRARGHLLYFSSPVVAGNSLYGMSVSKFGHFFCMDAQTGELRWEGPARFGQTEGGGNASIVRVGRTLLCLTDRCRLIVLDAEAPTYQPIAEYQITDTSHLGPPCVLGRSIAHS